MNKGELRAEVQRSLDCSAAEADRAVNAVLRAFERGLLEHGKLLLAGFGNFHIRDRAPRKIFNPRTGTMDRLPSGVAVTFKLGKSLKEKVVQKFPVEEAAGLRYATRAGMASRTAQER